MGKEGRKARLISVSHTSKIEDPILHMQTEKAVWRDPDWFVILKINSSSPDNHQKLYSFSTWDGEIFPKVYCM
jgi:hypothetical protein